MEYLSKLYLSDDVRKYARKIKRRLKYHKTDVGHYLITIASNPNDQIDIVPTTIWTTLGHSRPLPKVLGIAGTEEGALELVRTMTEECFRETGGADLKTYFSEKK